MADDSTEDAAYGRSADACDLIYDGIGKDDAAEAAEGDRPDPAIPLGGRRAGLRRSLRPDAGRAGTARRRESERTGA
jgi:hypothetical protein